MAGAAESGRENQPAIRVEFGDEGVGIPTADDFVVLVAQFLDEKKLQPGREYFIWLGSDRGQPVGLQVAFRLVKARTANSNRPGDLVRALGVAAGELRFHRQHCVRGAIR